MTKMTRRLNPWLIFLAGTIAISALLSFLARAFNNPRVSAAAVADLTLTVPALYYFLLVRTGHRSPKSIFVIAALGLWRASFLFPQIVPGKIWIGGALEFALIAAVVITIRKAKASSETDPVNRIAGALRTIIPAPTAAKAIASEISVLYYALAPRLTPDIPAGAQPFTIHKKSGKADLFGAIALASLLEIVPVHLLLGHWSRTAAWIATALSLYGALWLFAMARAFSARPTLITTDSILIRLSLLLTLRIPAAELRDITTAGSELTLHFRHPLTADKAAGFTTRLESFSLTPDDAAAFENAARQLLP
jgi:hypothetical protein